MPDRRKPPPIRSVQEVPLPPVEKLELSGGLPVHVVHPGEQEVLQIDFLIDAGRPREARPLAAKAVGALLREGSRNYSGAEIARQIDYHGAYLSTPFQLDAIRVSVQLLARHARRILPVIADLLLQPTFPEKELENFRDRSCRQLEVDLRKTDVVAYRELTERIFGPGHPYGYNSSLELYRQLSRTDIVDHYRKRFHRGNFQVILSGGVSEAVIQLIDALVASSLPAGRPEPEPELHVDAPVSGKFYQPLQPSVQTAVRLGRRLFNRKHPDYPGMYVLNTILGGYFGSRLMTNIREEKGYTYNIFSSLDTMRHDGYFYIGTEVSNEMVAPTRREIFRELDKLRSAPVSREELDMVRSYLMGTFLNALDGPLQAAALVRGMLLEDLPLSLFAQWMKNIAALQPEDLTRLARKYLHPEQMWEVIVGAPPERKVPGQQ